jgi:branched-chain amino acid transport system substrate-binding protein
MMKRSNSVISLFLVIALVFVLVTGCATATTTTVATTKAAGTTAAGTTAAATTAAGTTAAATTAGSKTFLIGTYLQMTGSNSIPGNDAKKGIDLAIKQINAKGGFNGATVTAKHYDTTGSTEEAVKVVQKMLSSDNVDAVIGSVNSNEVTACISYINDAKVFNFGLGTSATWMADTSRIWTFRASSNNNRIVPQDVDLIKQLKYTSVAVINGTDDTGKSTADAFIKSCEEKGVKVTTRQQCASTDTDFAGQITQIIASKPDTVFMSLIGSTFGPFVKQLRNMGYTGMIACKENFSTQYQQIAGAKNSNYIFYAYPYVTYNAVEDCSIPNVLEFLKAFKAEYGTLNVHESAYRGYDTMMAMWEAAKIAGKNDDESLRVAMSKVKIPGLGGTLDYTKGDREGYSVFKSFVLVDGKDIPLDDWLKAGGYEAYLKASGSAK